MLQPPLMADRGKLLDRSYEHRHNNSNARSHRRARRKSQKQIGGTVAEINGKMVKEGINCPASSLGRSNLDSFLDGTTPMVHRQLLSKTSMVDPWKRTTPESMFFFTLGDLWDAFDEWSAYGAGVPLHLPAGEVVVQYYVPYLSALQIYARDSSDSCIQAQRSLGEDSDFSDLDLRESSSEASIEMGRADPVWDASTQYSEDSDETFHQKKSENGQLLFEYFERISPYGRAPFSDKVCELCCEFPKLRSLRSYELSPASWVSVAWYPIYRIPTGGATMKDMATPFLTFHSLSTTSLQNQQSKETDAQIPVNVDEEKMVLPAFGLASYKMSWSSTVGQSERRRALSLASCADAWLKQLQVHHPDFDFFVSHEAFPRR